MAEVPLKIARASIHIAQASFGFPTAILVMGRAGAVSGYISVALLRPSAMRSGFEEPVIIRSLMRRNYVYALLGGIGFWLPDLVAKAMGANGFHADRVLTVVCPVSLLLVYVGIRIVGRERGRWSVPLWVLGGVWVLGPIVMSITFALDGGSWTRPAQTWPANLLIFAVATVFPPLCFVLSAYDGTLAALIIGSTIMGLECARLRSDSPDGGRQ